MARTDGSQYRRLTDDGFRDRGPAWSPDGQRIAFYSDRSNTYEAWTIRPDGSGLEQVTSVDRANFPIWSPDGLRLAMAGVGLKGWFILDSHSKAIPQPRIAPPDAAGEFWPLSWSASGQIAGIIVNSDATAFQLAVYSEASRRYHVVPSGTASTWEVPVWAGDDSRLIVRDTHGISIVHVDTGVRRQLLSVRGYAMGRSVGVSRDGHWITYTETGTEGDIWLATFGKK